MGDQVRELLNWARQRKILAAEFVGFTLVVGILIGSLVSGRVSATKGFGFPGTTATTLTVPDPIPATNTFAGIVNKVEPAVVNIATTQVLERRQARKRRAQPYDQGDPMQDFFDRFFDGRPDSPPPADRSLGSGVIVDKRGYILTNNHVIEQATKIQVQLNGETARYTAKLVGADEDTDLAVIKIDANKELPTAKLGNSDGVQVGERAADGQNPVAYLHTIRIAQLCSRQFFVGVDFNHGEVGVFIRAHQLGGVPRGLAVQLHLNLGGLLDDVIVGEDVAALVHDHA